MAMGRKPPDGPDIPDLDRGAPDTGTSDRSGAPAARQAPAPTPSPRPASGRAPANSSDYFGGGNFDSDSMDDFGPSIGLATDGPSTEAAAPRGRAAAPQAFAPGDEADLDAFEGSAANAQAVTAQRAAQPADAGRWLTGETPEPASLKIDTVEVGLTADYPSPPTNIALSAIYAAKVLLRKRALGGRIQALAKELQAVERQRDERVVAMVQDLRGKILMTTEGAKLFEPVAEIEGLALERRSALAGTSAEHDRRARELDDQIAARRLDLTAREAVIETAGAALAEQQRLLERAEGKKKRLYIEVRAILDVTEKSGGHMTAAQSSKVQALEAEIAKQAPELELAARGTEAARAAVTSAESSAKEAARQVREAERARRGLDQEFQKQIGARSQGVTEAERNRFDALVAVGRAALAARGRLVPVSAEALDGIARAQALVAVRATELEKHRRAELAYDKIHFRNGLATGAAGLVLLIILLRMLASL
jgi:hypothetical protein